jgi:EAL domain-containing protein (putative c-di-GMP-specific phosphodiesterase class I)
LKNLKLNKLKIDKSLIDKILSNREFVKGILNLGRSLNLKVLAEGVESKEQVDILKEMGCDYIQGYYYSKPLSSEDFDKLLKSNKKFN